MSPDIATQKIISFGARLAWLAREQPERAALIVVRPEGADRLSYRELDDRVQCLAHWLRSRGVVSGDTVVVALPTSVGHYAVTLAAWTLGACVLPIDPRCAPAEEERILALASARIVVRDMPDADLDTPPLPRIPSLTPQPGKAILSGGSTGQPKIIVDPQPWAREPGALPPLIARAGLRAGTTALFGGGLFHNVPFLWGHLVLFEGGTVVTLAKFDAETYVTAIERYRPAFLPTVPTIMTRVAKLPDIDRRDLSSVESVMHTGAPCPAWVKRRWCDLVGASSVVEAYGTTENIGACMIRGDEWLARPGSVGRPVDCELRVRDEAGRPVSAGVVGQIWMRPTHAGGTADYRGQAALRADSDGWLSVGDLGSLDADGYLYVADRRADLILSGGVNIYPAEIEASLSEHPAVTDVAVVGVPDDDWGQRVHAVVQTDHLDLKPEELQAFLATRLSPIKRPKSYAFVAELPRNDAGKLRRSSLLLAVHTH